MADWAAHVDSHQHELMLLYWWPPTQFQCFIPPSLRVRRIRLVFLLLRFGDRMQQWNWNRNRCRNIYRPTDTISWAR